MDKSKDHWAAGHFDAFKAFRHRTGSNVSRASTEKSIVKSRQPIPEDQLAPLKRVLKSKKVTYTLHGFFAKLLAESSTSLRSKDAVICGSKRLTFSQLDRVSDYIMTMLHTKENGADSPTKIAVMMEPSVDLISVIFGILKLGAAYIPIDPTWESMKIQRILEETQPQKVIYDDSRKLTGLELSGSRVYLEARTFFVAATELFASGNTITISYSNAVLPACIMYCEESGKTAQLSHQIIFSSLCTYWDRLKFAQDEIVVNKSSSATSDSLMGIFGALLIGHSLMILPKPTVNNVGSFFDTLQTFSIRRLITNPTELNLLCDYLEANKRTFHGSLKAVLDTGNENFTVELAKRFFSCFPRTLLGLCYTVTELAGNVAWTLFVNEADVIATVRDGVLPSGFVLDNFEIMIVDAQMTPVPKGATGELLVRFFPLEQREPQNTFDDTVNGHSENWLRTGHMAFINPQSRLLYVKFESCCVEQSNGILPVTNNGWNDMEENVSTADPGDSNQADTVSVPEAEEVVEPETLYSTGDLTAADFPSALRILLSSAALTGATTRKNCDLSVKDLKEYAKQILTGTLPHELNFALKNDAGEVVAVNIAYDPFATPQHVRELLYSSENKKHQMIVWVTYPFMLNAFPDDEPGILIESYLMSTDERMTLKEKFVLCCQMDIELEKRARQMSYRYIITKNYDSLTRRVSKSRGYQRWASYQLNRLALPTGEMPFANAPDSEKMSLDVRLLKSEDNENDQNA